jgi:hypothetical protein
MARLEETEHSHDFDVSGLALWLHRDFPSAPSTALVTVQTPQTFSTCPKQPDGAREGPHDSEETGLTPGSQANTETARIRPRRIISPPSLAALAALAGLANLCGPVAQHVPQRAIGIRRRLCHRGDLQFPNL